MPLNNIAPPAWRLASAVADMHAAVDEFDAAGQTWSPADQETVLDEYTRLVPKRDELTTFVVEHPFKAFTSKETRRRCNDLSFDAHETLTHARKSSDDARKTGQGSTNVPTNFGDQQSPLARNTFARAHGRVQDLKRLSLSERAELLKAKEVRLVCEAAVVTPYTFKPDREHEIPGTPTDESSSAKHPKSHPTADQSPPCLEESNTRVESHLRTHASHEIPRTRPPTYSPGVATADAELGIGGAMVTTPQSVRMTMLLPATLQANVAESPHGPKRRHRNELHAANPNRVSTMSMLPPYSESDSRAIRNSGAVQQTSPHPATNASSVETSSSKSLPPIPSEESEAEGLDSSTISLDLYMNARRDPDASTVESYVLCLHLIFFCACSLHISSSVSSLRCSV
ncbi:hypothetical protein C8R46DRAFT_1098261 [Mycena filopes]|nr:hypothetical protein C8R46DRAFT_1098261 [Mycena filopes]